MTSDDASFSQKPIIEINGIGKRYSLNLPGEGKTGTFWALKEINLSIYEGERVGIIGRNGAGKSTLLKILSRVIYPTVGEARIRGRVTSLLEVGTGFNNNATGRENIYINGALHGLTHSEIEERLDDIISFAELSKFIDTTIRHYSSGWRLQ